MEPRQYKLLAEVMMLAGIIAAFFGVVLMYGLSMNTAGAVALIIGCALCLISLPAFIILMMITASKELK